MLLPAELVPSILREIEGVLTDAPVGSSFQERLRRGVIGRDPDLELGRQRRWSLLPLLVCHALGGRWEQALPAAAATELFIAAGDALDDVMDEDIVPEVWGDWQAAEVVNAATALLALGQRALLRLRERGVKASRRAAVMDAWSGAIVLACAGQEEDMRYEGQQKVSPEAYLKTAEKKAAGLLSCACRCGALIAEAPPVAVRQLSRFGLHLGLAAQIANDVRDVLKPPGQRRDIARRKKTLPIIYGLRQAQGEERSFLRSFYSGDMPATPALEERIGDILTRRGALHYALGIAEIHRGRAVKALDKSGISKEAHHQLLTWLGY